MNPTFSKLSIAAIVGAAVLLAAYFSWQERMDAMLPIALVVGGLALAVKALRRYIERR